VVRYTFCVAPDTGAPEASPRSRVRVVRDALTWMIGAGLLLAVLVALFYWVPGLPDSPHGTRVHQLADSFGEAVVVMLVCGVMIRFVIRR
jgi:hypothetical protein